MIIAEVMGGLGNQMFIYAFARAYQLAHGGRCLLVDRGEEAVAHCGCKLQALSVSPDVEFAFGPDEVKRRAPVQNVFKSLMLRHENGAGGGMTAHDWQDFERRMAPLLNRLGVHVVTEGYLPPTYHALPKTLVAWGYFQGESYFAPYKDSIRAELRYNGTFSPENAALAGQIDAAACPVCLHLRRGDYLNVENALLQVCTPAYYAKALAAVRENLPGATLVVFSDDLPWVRQNLDTLGMPVLYANEAGSAVEDLALMQRCRHFVLSNSTYSWWAQYLGDAPDKQVFAPDRWYANGKATALYQPGWQLIATK